MPNENNPKSKNALLLNALPYLNILPLSGNLIDFSLLEIIGSEVPVQLISRFMKQDSIEIGINLKLSKKQKREEHEHVTTLQKKFSEISKNNGILHVGYPLLMIEDPALGKDIVAPLFLWEVELRNAENENLENWIISYDSISSFKFNDILKNYLVSRFDLDWDELIGAPEELKNKTLIAAINRLCDAIQIERPVQPKLFRVPPTEMEPAQKNAVYWAAVLGQIEPKENTVDLPLSLRPKKRRTWFTRIGAIPLNSDQEAGLNDILDGFDTVISGSEESGKTRTLSSAIPAFLSDHGSCLIISSEPATQKGIFFQLDSLGLYESNVLVLKEESNSINSLTQLLQELPESTKRIPKLETENYNLILQQYLMLRNSLAGRYDAMHKSLLEKLDWTNLVGRYLNNQRIDGKQYLSRILDSSDFKWTEEEYHYLLEKIRENQILFEGVQNLQHPLTAIQDSIFRSQSEQEAEAAVTEQVSTFTIIIRELYHNYTYFIDEYADDARLQFENHGKELKQKIADILRNIKVYQDVYGNSFDHVDGFTTTKLKILSVFSKKSQLILAAKDQIYKAFDDLKKIFESKRNFEYNLPLINSYLNLSEIGKDLKLFEKAIDEWLLRVPKIVKLKVKDLTLKLPLKPIQKRKFEELEYQVDQLFSQLNQSGIFKTRKRVKSQKATERESQLQDLLLEFSNIEMSLKNFSAYYKWRKHWLEISDPARRLITALIAIRPNSWETAFNSWYFYNYLDRHYNLNVPENIYPVESFVNATFELRGLLYKNAQITVKEQQSETLKQLRKEKNFQVSQISSKFRLMNLTQIFEEIGIDNISVLFPVIIATPEMAEKLFDYKVPLFDVVVIDAAQKMDLKTGKNIAKLGAQRIVLGTDGGDPNSYLNYVNQSYFFRKHHFNFTYTQDGKIVEKQKFENYLALPPDKTIFRDEVYNYLSLYFREDRLQKGVIVSDNIEIDIVVKSLNRAQPDIAIIVDGWLKNVAKYDVDKALIKSKKVKALNYTFHTIWSLHWWRNADTAVEELAAYIINLDGEESN